MPFWLINFAIHLSIDAYIFRKIFNCMPQLLIIIDKKNMCCTSYVLNPSFCNHLTRSGCYATPTCRYHVPVYFFLLSDGFSRALGYV